MNELKSIKIENIDGTLSEPIPIGTNAEYVTIDDEGRKKLNEYIKNNDNNINSLKTETSSNKNNIEIQKNRIDNLSSLKEGSTTGDAELIDIRVGYDGIIHTSAGDAVRTYFNQFNNNYIDLFTIEKSKNIFYIESYTDGVYYSISSGEYRYNEAFVAIDNYIKVQSEKFYSVSLFNNNIYIKDIKPIVCFYDTNKKFIKGVSSVSFQIPKNVAWIRLSLEKDYIKKQVLLEEGTESSKIWTPYWVNKHIKNEYIDKNFIIEDVINTYNLYKNNEITVDCNGTGDYETLQEAISNVTNNTYFNRYIIYIKEGTYNLAEGIKDGETDPSIFGVEIPNFTTLVGVGNKENIILKAEFSEPMQYVSTLNFKETGGIQNLTVIGKNTRYVIHDDYARQSVGYKRTVKHCIIKGISTYYSVVYGAGTGDGAEWEFEDVIFDGSKVGKNEKPANTFTVHNYLKSQKNRNIIFKNCRFISTNEKNVKFKTLAYRTATGADSANNMITNVQLIGCKFVGVSKGFELVEENAKNYGSGCLYNISGFANVNSGYDIITTDGIDYSERVNLI